MKYLLPVLFCFVSGVALAATVNDPAFVAAKTKGDAVYVPHLYDQGSMFEPENEIEIVKVGAIYPDFTPSLSPEKDVFGAKETKNYVSVRVNLLKDKEMTFAEFAESTIKFSTLKFGEPVHGLSKATKSRHDRQHETAHWFEIVDGKPVSYTACTVAIYEPGGTLDLQVPAGSYRCSHNFFTDDAYYIVTFDNRLLPQWKELQTKSIALMESFKSKETALARLK